MDQGLLSHMKDIGAPIQSKNGQEQCEYPIIYSLYFWLSTWFFYKQLKFLSNIQKAPGNTKVKENPFRKSHIFLLQESDLFWVRSK